MGHKIKNLKSLTIDNIFSELLFFIDLALISPETTILFIGCIRHYVVYGPWEQKLLKVRNRDFCFREVKNTINRHLEQPKNDRKFENWVFFSSEIKNLLWNSKMWIFLKKKVQTFRHLVSTNKETGWSRHADDIYVFLNTIFGGLNNTLASNNLQVKMRVGILKHWFSNS